MSPILQAALAYTRRGWLVLPLHSVQDGQCSCGRPGCGSIGKHPHTAHGLKDATTDEGPIREWWARWPDANVGVVTGNPSGLVVLDVDPRHGGDDTVLDLERKHGPLLKTIEVLTGGGGRHLFFQHPGGLVKSRPIAPGLDIKGDGGYVVAPPSLHASGDVYRWEVSSHPDEVPVATLPAWLLELLTKPAQPPQADQGPERAGGDKIPQGHRNDTLASLAGTMRRRGMSEEAIQQALLAENTARCEPPLSEEEVTRIAASVGRYAPLSHSDPPCIDHGSQHHEAGKPSRVSQADTLVRLCEEAETLLFHDPLKEAYAWVRLPDRREVLKVRSGRFRDWLAHRHWAVHRKAPSSDALQSASTILAALARYEGPEHPLWNRVAWHEQAVWYDLGGAAVRINADGWEVITEPPLLFLRYAHQRSQVEPVSGGDLRAVLRWVNVPGVGVPLSPAPLLVLGYLVLMLVPHIPHPVLCVHAEQGSGKTTLFKIMRELIDPSATPTLGPPDSYREFVQLAAHHWLVLLDNLSTLPDWLSDAICRCVTGEGFSKRELYSDDEDMLYSFRRGVGLNGINLVPSKPDLLDRAFILSLEPITDTTRRPEVEFWEEFAAAKPRLLGALFTTLRHAMAVVHTVTVPGYPRLADFARWGMAVARALGVSDTRFSEALATNTRAQAAEALQASPVALALLAFLEGKDGWQGSPTELLKELDQIAPAAGVDTKSRLWPKDVRWVWRRIKEVRPNLRGAGWAVDRGEADGKAWVRITRVGGENDGSVPDDPETPQGPADLFGDSGSPHPIMKQNVPDQNLAHNQAAGDTGDIGIIFPALSGQSRSDPCDPIQGFQDDGTGWPGYIPGFGHKAIGSLTRCTRCVQETWARYGEHPLCRHHARQAAPQQGVPKTVHAGSDPEIDRETAS